MIQEITCPPLASSESAAAARTSGALLRKALRFPLYFAITAFVSWTALRIALYCKFRPAAATFEDTVKAFAAGLHIDAAMALAVPVFLVAFAGFLTTLGWVALAPLKFALPPLRRLPLWNMLFTVVGSVCCAAGVFLLISEWFFFEEFESRFNCVAIDYLLYPHEVFTNIRESYPVPVIISVCLLLGSVAAWLAFRRYRPDWLSIKIGAGVVLTALLTTVTVLLLMYFFKYGVAAVVVMAAGVAGFIYLVRRHGRALRFGQRSAGVLTWMAAATAAFFSIQPAETAFSSQRVMNELANNGWASAIRAAWSRNLEFTAFYVTLPRQEAFVRARKVLEEPGVTFVGPEVPPEPRPGPDGLVSTADNEKWLDAARLSLVRDVAGDPAKPKRNVCIILVESLGSEFVGSLGRVDKTGKPETLTPEMDKIAAEEGLFFTNILADGNRTIRGFEATYSSIPPLPGDSILARDKTDRVETIGRVLKRDGYNSLFVYGGRGSFDYISGYVLPNGWDHIVEEKDYATPTHVTAWGVCDEDLYHRGIEEMRQLHDKGEPFLVSYMTVSNHKPYTYPAGRVPEDPQAKFRNHAVKYSDWALGDFFRRCKKEAFWKDTVFLVAGDHGARVYGSQTIPLQSYRIPMLIVGPCVVEKPQRVEVPGCQLDFAPTLLGLIGRPYRSLFFGRDLLKPGAAERSRGLMHHNRSIAIYHDQRQVVYGLNKTLEYWQGDIASGNMARVTTPDAAFSSLQADGSALFTAADALYTNFRYILPE